MVLLMPIQRHDGYRLWVGGPVPKGSDGITLGSLVIVREGCESSANLIRHERAHVRQWRRHGVFGFSVRYVGSYLVWRLRLKGHRGAYLRIPLEIQAEWEARRSPAPVLRTRVMAEADRASLAVR